VSSIASSNNWLVYMILTSDNQVYTGITTDMSRRWRAHESGKAGARYFRGRRPVQLCFLEDAHNRSTASKREYAIKALSASSKRTLIKQSHANLMLLLDKYELHHLGHAEQLANNE
jgi:putative endonuclease